MENISDPKYKIGDVVVVKQNLTLENEEIYTAIFQLIIKEAEYLNNNKFVSAPGGTYPYSGWVYYHSYLGVRTMCQEDQIIKKLN